MSTSRQSNCVTNDHSPQVAVFNSEQTLRYTSTFLYSLRTSAGRPDFEHLDKLGLLHYRGTRAGSHVRMRRERFKERNSVNNECYPDELGCIRRAESTFRIPRHPTPPKARVLTDCMKYSTRSTPGQNVVNINISSALFNAPSVYIINPTSIAKPNALDCLKADISSLDIGVIMISETWLKKHHDSRLFSIPGFTLFRHDRERRRGGGVAIYIRDELGGSVFQDGDRDNPLLEILWITFDINGRKCYYGVIYHPPNPLYSKQEILDSLQKTVDQAWSVSEEPFILLGGDFNQLPDTDLQALGLCTEFNAPTHDGHSLDRIYVSEPHYKLTFAVTSSIFTKHKAVVAQNNGNRPIFRRFVINNNNNSVPCTSTDDNKKYKYVGGLPFRKISPGQHAALLKYLQTYSWEFILEEQDTQTAFDLFYECCYDFLNAFYPEKYVKIKSADPSYMTPQINFLLLEKNKLMRKGEMSAAANVACRIGKLISAHNSISFKSGSMHLDRVSTIKDL